MTNTLVVCLVTLFCCTNLSLARQVPKICSKGPSVWCENLRSGADCGAVGHCTTTVWEKQNEDIRLNDVSTKFVRLFEQLKDVRELINEEYLATRISSECQSIEYPGVRQICKENTAKLEQYINHVLKSDTTPETMCKLVGMCNNEKIDNILSMNKKKNIPNKIKGTLLGGTKCTWGPSYWCSNFSTGHECKATHHCATRVWSKMSFPEDDDSICKICTDMVQQARDQLQSNETQEELKEVFEGSCKLIPIKVVAKECMKLADDFVPELVETLASQMNPQAVCSVAGLCNNAKIDSMLERFNSQLQLRVECNNCQRTVGGLRKKFDATSYDDFLVGLLQACRKMDSLSDSCSMLVFQYYENILEAVKKDFTSESMCHVSGQCSYKFHQHDDFTFPNEFTDYRETDDVPCELCEQLVKHLRDVLVANTTEIEFYKVLKGLCKQSGKFKDECLHLAEQYYPIIYKFLTDDLKADVICAMMGVCHTSVAEPIAPLVAQELAVKTVAAKPIMVAVPISSKQSNVRVMEQASIPQLPLERMFVAAPQGKAACSFCQYFLHYLQVEISDAKTEDAIESAVDKACERLPKEVDAECKEFVSQYGPSVIALLVQNIDPASVCPGLGICPQTEEVKKVDINAEKSNCPLCLFAVEQLETMLKNNRSEETIRNALDNLCTHLSAKLRTECVDFVDSYTNQLVEMLVADMNAQEICVFLKLCKDEVKDPLGLTNSAIDKFHDKPQLRGDRNNFKGKSLLPAHMLVVAAKDGDIETNEIPDHTVNGRPVTPPLENEEVCLVCEFVLKEIDHQLEHKHNEDEIKKVLHKVCVHMPKSFRAHCDQFVEKYTDVVLGLLTQGLDPKKVCHEIKLCKSSQENIADVMQTIKIPDHTVNGRPVTPPLKQKTVCVVCEFVLKEIDDQIKDKHNDDEIKKVVHGICAHIPKSVRSDCDQFVEKYADLVISLLAQELDPAEVCEELKLCEPSQTKIAVVKQEILDCAVCETVVMAVKKVLSNDKVDRDIVHIIEKSCGMLPAKYNARCHTMLEIYGDSVIHLIEEFGTKGVCQKIGLCSPSNTAYVQMYRGKRN